MKKLLIFCFAFAFGFEPAQSQLCDIRDYPFKCEFLKAKFKRSIFSIASGTTSGSGFLIDKDRWLILTAFHVVKKDTSNILLSNPFVFNNQSIKARVIAIKDDICLLELSDVKLANKYRDVISEFDISMNDVTSGVDYYSLSLPNKGLGDIVSNERVSLKTKEKNGIFEVNINARDGMSGSPLLDGNGYVIGIAGEANQDRVSGYFYSISKTIEILRKVGVRQRARVFFNALRSGQVDKELLTYTLEADQFSNPVKNIDIMNSIFDLPPRSLQYDSSINDFEDCINCALVTRGMWKIVPTLYKCTATNLDPRRLYEFAFKQKSFSDETRFQYAALINDVSVSKFAGMLRTTESDILNRLDTNPDGLAKDIVETMGYANSKSTAELFNCFSLSNLYINKSLNQAKYSKFIPFSKEASKAAGKLPGWNEAKFESSIFLFEMYKANGDKVQAKTYAETIKECLAKDPPLQRVYESFWYDDPRDVILKGKS